MHRTYTKKMLSFYKLCISHIFSFFGSSKSEIKQKGKKRVKRIVPPIYATPRPTNFQLSTLSHSLPFLLLFLSTLFPFTSHPPFPLSLQNPFLSTLFALSLAPCTPRASKTPLEGHWPSSNRLPPRGSLRFSATRLYSSWGLRFWSLVCLSPGSVLRFCLGRSLGALLGPLGSSSLPPTLLL